MSDPSVKALIYSQKIDVNAVKICEHKQIEFFTDIQLIKTVIDTSAPNRFVVLFLDEPAQRGDREEIENKRNVETTLICPNSTNNMPNLRNVLNISKNLPLFKRTLKNISVLQWLSKEFYGLGQSRWGEFFEGQTRQLFQWLMGAIELMVCHVLLIPLNTNHGNLMRCQQAMIEKCRELFHGKEIRVCTFYDYIFFEESDHEGTDSLDRSTVQCQRELKEAILNMIPKLAPIRIYLVKDGDKIVDDLVKILIAKESKNGEEKYENVCAFMEYDRITKPEVKKDLAAFLRTKWQLDPLQTKAAIFHDIVTDPLFRKAVLNVYDAHPQREDHAEVPFSQQKTDYYRSTSDSNESNSSIDQAQTRKIENDEEFGTAMDTSMQREYQKSPENDCSDKFETIHEAQSGPRDRDKNLSTAMDTRVQRDYRKSPPNQ